MLSGRLVNSVSRKKIVLLIVEGPSDDEALSLLFTNFYKRYSQTVMVEVLHCDITSDWNIRNTSIRNSVTNVVKKHASEQKLKKGDYEQIIHIVDTDGTFISDEHIIQDVIFDKPYYTLENIRCSDVVKIQERNVYKSGRLKELSSIKKLWTVIPYRVYFMSCNLDHVLYDKLNISDKEKEDLAHQFAKQYKDDLDGFISFIGSSSFTVSGNYKETWDFIQLSENSLNRYSNLHLCFYDEYLASELITSGCHTPEEIARISHLPLERINELL